MADFEDEVISDVESEGSVISEEDSNKKGEFKLKNKKHDEEEDDEKEDDEKDEKEEDDDEDDDEEDDLSELDKDEEKNDDESIVYDIDELGEHDNFDINLDEDDDDDDDDDQDYLKKFDENLQQNIIQEHHPELRAQNYEEIEALCTIVKDSKGNIVDPLHKTIPFISKYEKARVLGERAKQLDSGANSFIEDLDPTIIDGYMIALKEFEEKKIPFIIQRPLPNGVCEYWRLKDLDVLS
tara:strand:+ start:7301 stop:8017 length:717 start_codon:yes stop_codon:yes gene_type:complete